MTGRILTWTGNAGDADFATAANWDNERGYTAKYAPDRADTVVLSGSGTIGGSGAVATIDVSGTFVFPQVGATVIALTVSDTGTLLLEGAEMRARSIDVANSQTAAYFVVSEGSTLSAAGAALDISVNTSTSGGSSGGLYIEDATVDLGAGTLTLGSQASNETQGLLTMGSGTLSGGRGAVVVCGSGGGVAHATLVVSTIAIGGALDVGIGGGSFGVFSADQGAVSAGVLNVGLGGNGQVSLDETNLTLGSIGCVGLDIASAGAGGGQGLLQTSNDTVTIAGLAEIGLSGEGAYGVGSSSMLTTDSGVDIGQSGQDSHGTGTLNILVGGVWHDTGAVRLAAGTLSIYGNGNTDTIDGNLVVGSPTATDDATVTLGEVTLDVSGTVLLNGSSYSGGSVLNLSLDGAALKVDDFAVGGYGTSVLINGLPSGEGAPSLAAGTLSLGGSLSTIVAEHGALVTIGTSQDSRAAMIAGSFSLENSTLIATGAVGVTGELLLQSSTMTVTAAATAIHCEGGDISVNYSSLTAIGGITIEGHTFLGVDNGQLASSAGSSNEALILGSQSVLAIDNAAVMLTGSSTIYGQVQMMDGAISDNGTLTLADATVEGSGTLSALSTVIRGVVFSTANAPVFLSPILGNGTLALAGTVPGSGLSLLGSVGDAVNVDFVYGGTLTLGDAAAFGGMITDWGSGDTLDLLNVEATSDSVHGQTLSLYDSEDHVVASLRFGTSINANEFVLQQGQSNTMVTYKS